MPASITQRRGRVTPTVRKAPKRYKAPIGPPAPGRSRPGPFYPSPAQAVKRASRQISRGAKRAHPRRQARRNIRVRQRTPRQAARSFARQTVRGVRARERQAQHLVALIKQQAAREAAERRRGIYRAKVSTHGPSLLERLGSYAEGATFGVVGDLLKARSTPSTSFDDEVVVKATKAILKARRDAQIRSYDNRTYRALGEAIKDPGRAFRRYAAARDRAELGKMGVGPDASEGVYKFARGLADAAEATYERPGKTVKATAKSIPGLLAGVAPGIVEAINDPVHAVEATKKEYRRRYGKAGTEENVRRIQDEGFELEFLDALAAGQGLSRGAGFAARSRALGPRAYRAATEERPLLRTAPGTVRPQRKAKGFATAVAQRRLDKSRLDAQVKRLRKADEDRAPGEERRHFIRPEDVEGIETRTVVPRTKTGGKIARGRWFQEESGRSRTRMRRGVGEEVTKGSRKTEGSLSDPERVAFAYGMEELVPLKGTREAKLEALDRLEKFFEKGRSEAGTVIRGRRRIKHNDELRKIRYLKENVEKAFTGRLAEAVRVEKRRERALSKGDPRLVSRQAALARIGPQAELLGVKRFRGETEAANQADAILRLARREASRTTRKVETMRRAEARQMGKIEAREGRRPPPKGSLEAKVRALKPGEGINLSKGILSRVERTHAKSPQYVVHFRSKAPHRTEKGWAGVRKAAQEPERRLSKAEAERAWRAQGRVTKAELEARAAQDVLRAASKGRIKGEARVAYESAEDYGRRAAKARVKAGLGNPGYFKHQARPFEVRRADYAHGTGSHGAMRGPKRRGGSAFRTGQRDTRMEVLHQSRVQNIKGREQTNFVISNAEANAFQRVRDAETGDWIDLSKGRPLDELVEAVDRSALHPNDVAFVNVGKLRKDLEEVRPAVEDEDFAGRAAKGFEANARSYEDALGMVRNADDLVDDAGWRAIPADIRKQQEAATQQGPAGRLIRKYIKGIPSKLLLGTNPSWAIIQVLNNQLLAHLGGVGNIDLAKSAAFFKKHPEAAKAMDDYLGSTTFEAERAGVHMGSSIPRMRLIEEYRAFKATPFAQSAGRKNPLDWFFRMDHANNTLHRRAVAYDFMRGEAYRRMGQDAAGFMAALHRLEHAFDLGPEGQMLEMFRDPATLEQAAAHVDDMLGNYSRYSVWERRLLEQNVMFYGFLRFSLRFTLYTMPFKHPIKANVLANLSKLHEREVRKLLGLNRRDPLPPGALASFYRVKDGRVQELPLQRLNPAMNVLTQGDPQLKNAFLALPPLMQAVADQVYHKDLFTGQAHKIQGESTARETPANKAKYPQFDARIFLRDALSLFAPYREWERVAFEGRPQGADTLAFDPRPTKYKDPEIRASINRRARRERAHPWYARVLAGQGAGFRESDIRRRSEALLEATRELAEKDDGGSGAVDWRKVRIPKGGAGIDWSQVRIK